ncbi:MAG: hypothetical protein HOV87_22190 [Catenulispora sp.]|nr:hypothetical protein [Catenulispora sp.]
MDFLPPPQDDAPPMASPLAGVVAAFMPRLAEFAFDPGLVAAIDQHAAAVCDTLNADLFATPGSSEAAALAMPDIPPLPAQRTVAREDLSDYVLGFNDVLAEQGWQEPVGYDFATLRLTAICWLVREKDLLAF